MAKKTKTQKYANPVTGEYAELITDAPYDNVDYTQASIVDDLLPKAVKESIERPVDPVDEANEAINTAYPWAVPSMTAPQRAILCELYRIRKALEAK
jgi:hypothetical protein